jgi:hypothetical protein
MGDGQWVAADVSDWPVRWKRKPLEQFLKHEGKELSLKAAYGFYSRVKNSTLHRPTRLEQALEAHIRKLGGRVP